MKDNVSIKIESETERKKENKRLSGAKILLFIRHFLFLPAQLQAKGVKSGSLYHFDLASTYEQ